MDLLSRRSKLSLWMCKQIYIGGVFLRFKQKCSHNLLGCLDFLSGRSDILSSCVYCLAGCLFTYLSRLPVWGLERLFGCLYRFHGCVGSLNIVDCLSRSVNSLNIVDCLSRWPYFCLTVHTLWSSVGRVEVETARSLISRIRYFQACSKIFGISKIFG